MAEESILELIILLWDQWKSSLQWWASISFGLIALAHFSARKLNLPVVSLLVTLYVGFTVFIADHVLRLTGYLEAHYDELRALQEAGELTGAGRSFLTTTGLPGSLYAIAILVSFWGAFLGTIWYLFYAYRKAIGQRE